MPRKAIRKSITGPSPARLTHCVEREAILRSAGPCTHLIPLLCYHEVSGQAPDPRPGFYYVTAVDGPRVARILGPFVDDHASALAAVDAARAEAERRDPWAAFWAFGTCRSSEDLGEGALGRRLTATPAPAPPARPRRSRRR